MVWNDMSVRKKIQFSFFGQAVPLREVIMQPL